MAYQGHIVVPTTHDRASKAIESLAAAMAVEFGGYSIYEGAGGWDAGDELVAEQHVRLVVNAQCDEPHQDKEWFKEWLRIEAMYLKEKIEDDAVLFEVREIEMELV